MRLLPFIMIVICSVQPAIAADPAPQVDAKLSTQGDLWQGQRVSISITVKTPDTFASAVAFDLPQVSGAILIPPQGSPVLGTETIGDDTFTTQTHDLTVFPQQSGTITIPAFTIRFDSSAGFDKPVHSRTLTTTPLSITVKRPPGTESLAMVLTTTKLEVSETWKPQPSEKPVAVGKAFTRTIQVTADNLPGLLLTTFHTKPPEGLRFYPGEPQVDDQSERGDLVGHRTETLTIICEQPGKFELPAMKISWWNPEEQQLHDITLPAQSFAVTSLPHDPVEEANSPPPHISVMPWLVALAVSGIVACGVYWSRGTILQHWLAYQRNRANTEHHFFQILVRACHSGDPHATYRALRVWMDKLASDPHSSSLDALHAINADTALSSAVAELESTLYGPPASVNSGTWQPQQLLQAVIEFRQRWKQSTQASGLPEMNPVPG